jgi:hypothetical protein
MPRAPIGDQDALDVIGVSPSSLDEAPRQPQRRMMRGEQEVEQEHRSYRRSATRRPHRPRPWPTARPGRGPPPPRPSAWVGRRGARRIGDECLPANRRHDGKPGSVSDRDRRWGRDDSWGTSGPLGVCARCQAIRRMVRTGGGSQGSRGSPGSGSWSRRRRSMRVPG